MSETLLQVENLRTYFHTFRGVVKAVDGISFSLDEGQVLGIVCLLYTSDAADE